MTMTASRLGQINKTGDEWALFMKNYAAEVDTAFVEAYKLDGRIMLRTISAGKSQAFPAMGTIDAHYHVPGTEVETDSVEHNERIITLDPVLISGAFIANIDEAMNHYEVRSEYTRQQGAVLAKRRMMNELRCAIMAARQTTPVVAGQPGGAVIKNAAMATDAVVLANAFRAARQIFDEKGLPDMASEFSGVLRPAQYYLLTQNKDLIDRDINTESKGSFNDAVISSVARIPLVKVHALPSTNETADTSVLSKYRGDYSDTVAALFHRSAVGTLQLQGLSVEDEYSAAKQGTLMLSKYAMGHGALRADGAIELSSAT